MSAITSLPAFLKSRPRILVFTLSMLICMTVYMAAPHRLRAPIHIDYKSQLAALQQGRFFSDMADASVTRYPPIYVFVIHTLYKVSDITGYSRQFTVSVGFMVMLSLCSVLILKIAGLAAGSPHPIISALLFTTHLHVLFTIIYPLSLLPFTLLLYTALYNLFKSLTPGASRISFAICGLFTALAMLTRPIALFLPGLFGAVYLLFKRGDNVKDRAITLILFVVTVITILMPWELFIYNREGAVLPLSSGGVRSMRDGLSFNNKIWRHKLPLPRDVETLTQAFYKDYHSYNSAGDIAAFCFNYFKKHPLTTAKLAAIKASRCWYGTDSQNPALERQNLLLLFLYILPITAGVCFYLKRRGWRDVFFILIMAMTLYFWAMTFMVLSITRYMVPIIGLLVIFIPEVKYKSFIRLIRKPL